MGTALVMEHANALAQMIVSEKDKLFDERVEALVKLYRRAESFLPSPAGTSQIIPDIFDTLHPGVDLAVMSETKGEALPLPQHTERYRQIFSRQNAVLITSVFP